MYSKNSVWLLVLVILSIIGCAGSNSPDEASIKEMRARSNQAIAAKDTTALGLTMTNDVHLITSRNAEATGRSQNMKRFAEEFRTKADVIYIRTPDVIKVFNQWNMASEYGHWVGHWTDTEGNFIELSGTYHAKWHQLNGNWLIRSEVFVPLACKGGRYCDKSPL